jgi:hypothetical protein
MLRVVGDDPRPSLRDPACLDGRQGVTFGMLRPRLDALTDLTEVLHATEEGMLGQQGALRAWVVTGDDRFLEGDRVGKQQARPRRSWVWANPTPGNWHCDGPPTADREPLHAC